jgi:NAD(P)-dependent dehydrogenase (short-subunit alcohol dehydrogenase family)
VRAELAAAGAQALFVPAELADLDQVRSVLAETDREFGRVDCLVNAAAITDRRSILDTTPELFERMFAVNVRAPFFLMQDAARLMRRAGTGGTMVNILSTSSHGGQHFLAAYSSSKGALGVLTRNAAYALMRDGIRINGLNIGWMNTPGEHTIQKVAHDAPPDWLAKAGAGLPLGRLLDPAEVARATAFLLSAESMPMSGALVDFDQSVQGAGDPPRPTVRLGSDS